MKNIDYLFNSNVDENIASQYINYYFYDMVKLSREKKIFYEKSNNYFISIMKDEMDRKLNGSGKLREKPWSNFLFYFIDVEFYKELFGTNEKHRDIANLGIDGTINLTQFEYNYYSKNPNLLYSHRKNNHLLAKYIFDRIKEEKSFLFVRSYVYITIVLYSKDEITKGNYLTYYFNTNYKFTETNGKTNFIANVSNSYLVSDIEHELAIIQDNNRDIFDCIKAYNNTLDYINNTELNLKNIVDTINSDSEFILIEGSARTGKTIIAMSLLRLFPESNLLVMNYYFYQALKDAFAAFSIDFPQDRIFHQAYGKKGFYGNSQCINFDFLIIDECQRLGEKYGILDSILSSDTHKKSIFLGDNLQRLKEFSDDGISYIKEKILNKEKELVLFKFSNSVGIPPEILKNVKYLLNDPTIISPHYLGEYEINVFDDEFHFFNAYQNDHHKNKHLATIHYPVNNFSNIGSYSAFPYQLVNSDYPYFLNKEIIDNYYLSPFELISREVESIYIYIRDNVNDTNLNGFAFYNLYVLMTRATISLNIYCQNSKLNEMLKLKLSKIKEFSSHYDNNVESCIKQGQFDVDYNILNDFLNVYQIDTPEEKIRQRCITRLVHFTEASNIESIIKFGLLPRDMLNSIEFDYNDENRNDGYTNAICLSVENPNVFLLNSYKNKYPKKKYKLITINPSILYSSFINNERIELVPRFYCNYNAAAKYTSKSRTDIDIMFSNQVQTYYYIFNRKGRKDSEPTCNQAEILFFGRIPPEYIESIEDI